MRLLLCLCCADERLPAAPRVGHNPETDCDPLLTQRERLRSGDVIPVKKENCDSGICKIKIDEELINHNLSNGTFSKVFFFFYTYTNIYI